jgi:hypothetical protein
MKMIFCSLVLFAACHSFAHSIEEISAGGNVNNLSLRSISTNMNGDFVAISHSNVFAGNHLTGSVERVFGDQTRSFHVSASIFRTFGEENISLSFEYYDGRIDINEQGDFIVASNAGIFVGNVGDSSFKEVFKAEKGTEFQKVLINESGYYIAASYSRLFGGRISENQASVLLENAVGNFASYSIYSGVYGFETAVGETHLALNDRGQFLAGTSSALYGGDIAGNSVEKIFEERLVDFRRVSLRADGGFFVITREKFYRGRLY